ncbi:uncharacterized protein LOC127253831 [Andrographis paniculata]|uniref:uncharacterized protein LOC127253831 n=1 Tax=Andrographis paniculata TaxID=175694 RepID=UPI0021E98A8D|nr:uncharacterized protein LOC127253831 [Andrographis paniculata]XP_051134565.1 uncharacterized protein LOC127253831 [Andrographis paniculata]
MAESINPAQPLSNERIEKEAPQLVGVLKEMKEGLDTVRSKIQALTAKVKANSFPTSDGISYLEAKHLLLLSYCQSLVYYLLRKAKGSSIQGHPVVRSLVEIRLFLEKIRPVDKKLEYQVQKLTRTATSMEKPGLAVKETDEAQGKEDMLQYRPNPELLVSKTNAASEDGSGVYRPPKFAPSLMDEEKISRHERNAMRKEKETLRRAKQSTYVQELLNDLEGRPEEIRDNIVSESGEVKKYISKMEERARQEEELFTRAPLTKDERKKMKLLKRSRNGLNDLTESFYDEIKSLPMEDSMADQSTSFNDASTRGKKKFKKHKRKH